MVTIRDVLLAGAIAGAILGLLASFLADVLPGRYGITHLVRGTARTRRYIVLAVLGAAIGAGIMNILAGVPDNSIGNIALHFALNAGVAAIMLAGAAIDFEHMILPNEVTFGAALVCLLSSPARSVGWRGSVGGAVLGLVITVLPFYLYKKIKGQSGMGLGDAKLAVAAGAWHGIEGALFVIFAGMLQYVLLALGMRMFNLSYSVPESVRAEIADLKKRAAAGDKDAAEELADDPLAAEDEEGLMKMRLPLGPALILASLEALFLRRWISESLFAWFLQ